MKLKAPKGVGDPCIAGVTLEARGGVYEVEADIGSMLIECFGFIEVRAGRTENTGSPSIARRGKSSSVKSSSVKLPPKAANHA